MSWSESEMAGWLLPWILLKRRKLRGLNYPLGESLYLHSEQKAYGHIHHVFKALITLLPVTQLRLSSWFLTFSPYELGY